jgi:hypothetical protein
MFDPSAPGLYAAAIHSIMVSMRGMLCIGSTPPEQGKYRDGDHHRNSLSRNT